MDPFHSLPDVLFLLGKGGAGRTTMSAALAHDRAVRCSEKVLLVQWALRDMISPLFGQTECGHKHRELLPGLSVMNYDADEAMREYFVDHLNMGLFYKFVLENQQVQKLIHAAPGLEELFFLGRLFWLVELAWQERGYRFDRIIIDSPATGHGSALFGVAATISRFKLNGPLVSETARVAQMLEDPKKVGTAIVTLPEELPVEETLEMIPVLEKDLGRPPLFILLNRSLSPLLKNGSESSSSLSASLKQRIQSLAKSESRITIEALYRDLARRLEYEHRLRSSVSIPVIAIADRMIMAPDETGLERIQALGNSFAAVTA
jgi:anion-transporting  ArsA/GET3 family ATPase